MATSDGRRKSVNECHALKSTSCLPHGLERPDLPDVAAVLGQQPRHWDVPDSETGGHLASLALAATDVPLSVMVAIEPGAKLWIYPDGCDSRDATALLVELEVGDVLVWRGDLVHAGAGYGVEHYRIHAYVDSPFFTREPGTGPCTRRVLFGAENDAETTAAKEKAAGEATERAVAAAAAAKAKAAADAKAAKTKATAKAKATKAKGAVQKCAAQAMQGGCSTRSSPSPCCKSTIAIIIRWGLRSLLAVFAAR